VAAVIFSKLAFDARAAAAIFGGEADAYRFEVGGEMVNGITNQAR
jgi:hypothetical protein